MFGSAMAARFIVTAETQDDLVATYDWYEAQRVGLGEDFLDCLDACFERIRRTPELCAVAFESYRRALVRRFPYAVIYEANATAITIYGVFHTSRDSDTWRLRLP
jgi:toxin ParE1/3/4